jgi:hypothetical protein
MEQAMSNPIPPDEIRQIPSWTRKYAQNRALPQFVVMAVWGLLFSGIFWSAYAGGQAHRAGQTLRFGLWLAVAVVCTAANLFLSIYLSFPGRAKRVVQMLTAWLYKSEGQVTIELPKTLRVSPMVPVLFAVGVLGQVVLAGSIPVRYQQPVSALYMIPFMLYIVFACKSVRGLWMTLWPALYALHAVLLLVGAPIVFENQWEFLNMLIPTAGYGALSFLAAHLYSRFALRRLRHLG